MTLKTETYLLNINKNSLIKYYNFLDNSFKKTADKNSVITKYLNLGIKTIRLQIAFADFLPQLEKYFSCSLKDTANNYDATIYIWKDTVYSYISEQYNKSKWITISHEKKEFMQIDLENNIINAENKEEEKYYFIAENYSYDILSKQGHLFVKSISKIIRTEYSALVHSAAVGINNKGILISAKGGSGKSTLSVSCLTNGFQYVSDDYLILKKSNNKLYASPIYSIITLSPQIYKQMTNLKSEFMCNNYNNTKYILNISSYDINIINNLEIKAVVFPKISNIAEPTIEKTNKNTAVTQLVYSTATQMNNNKDTEYIKLLISFIKDLDFYQINLSQNLDKNVTILKQFIKEL
ncbi:hypothetical protein [Candidatus Ruminimicrobium bovinum]|uniref:hypothetical protein n=1 Tax=Candidatus Ruminimicrobium bovinum TaxID=3242779 RepID=UPI0039B9BA5C